MSGQILKQESKEESAIEIVLPKEAVKELLAKLKTLKDRKDDLLFPIKDELEEIEEKAIHIQDEIILIMQDVKETIKTDNGAAIFKLMPNPREYYDAKALDAITEKKIRDVLDRCKKMTKQGDPKVKIEIW